MIKYNRLKIYALLMLVVMTFSIIGISNKTNTNASVVETNTVSETNDTTETSNEFTEVDIEEFLETSLLVNKDSVLTSSARKVVGLPGFFSLADDSNDYIIDEIIENTQGIVDDVTAAYTNGFETSEETTKEETAKAEAVEVPVLQFDTDGWASIDILISAYCDCEKCNGSWAGSPTASGTPLVVGRTIAVDPKVIPLGSYVEIDGHIYVAEDTGSGIKGARIDLLFGDHQEALNWGMQWRTVRVSQTRENFKEYLDSLNAASSTETETETVENSDETVTENTDEIEVVDNQNDVVTETAEEVENNTENVDGVETSNVDDIETSDTDTVENFDDTSTGETLLVENDEVENVDETVDNAENTETADNTENIETVNTETANSETVNTETVNNETIE